MFLLPAFIMRNGPTPALPEALSVSRAPVEPVRAPATQAAIALLLSVFAACSAAIFRFLMARTGNDRALCDDLMQTLWLRASQGAPGRGEVPEGEIEFWLRAVARNLLVTHLRKEGAARRSLPRADAQLATDVAARVGSGSGPALGPLNQEARDQLLLAMTELPAAEQDLLVAHYMRGEAHAKLAERLGLSARSVEARLYRARKALRDRLQAVREEMK